MAYFILVPLLFLYALSAGAADLGAPRLSSSPEASWLLAEDRYLSSGGVRFGAGRPVSLEPLVGLGYGARRFEQGLGTDSMLYKVHAQAGGRIRLLEAVYLSGAARVPIYSYEYAGSRGTGPPPSVAVSRYEYDFLRLPGRSLSWTGELGIHLGIGADLAVYYDQIFLNSLQPGGMSTTPEERFGTRIIFRFK